MIRATRSLFFEKTNCARAPLSLTRARKYIYRGWERVNRDDKEGSVLSSSALSSSFCVRSFAGDFSFISSGVVRCRSVLRLLRASRCFRLMPLGSESAFSCFFGGELSVKKETELEGKTHRRRFRVLQGIKKEIYFFFLRVFYTR